MALDSLLPFSATPQEAALELAIGTRISGLPVPIRDTWNPNTCPADKLAFLAWAFGVDEWDASWPDEYKRLTIKQAVLVQARKGSIWSIRRVLENAGYGAATIQEGVHQYKYDGATHFDGMHSYGGSNDWASYTIQLTRPMTNAQAAQVRRILNITAPARCSLATLSYTAVTNLYDGKTKFNGVYNYGAA